MCNVGEFDPSPSKAKRQLQTFRPSVLGGISRPQGPPVRNHKHVASRLARKLLANAGDAKSRGCFCRTWRRLSATCEICPSSCISRDAWGLLSCQDAARHCMPCHAMRHSNMTDVRGQPPGEFGPRTKLLLPNTSRHKSSLFGLPADGRLDGSDHCGACLTVGDNLRVSGGPCRSFQAKLPTESPRLDITTFKSCLASSAHRLWTQSTARSTATGPSTEHRHLTCTGRV